MKQRTIKYKGLDLQLNIDIDTLVDNVKSKYKGEIAFLRKLLNKRESYIQKLHEKLRDDDAIIYMLIDCHRIYKKVRHNYDIAEKDLIVLNYLSMVNMATIQSINEYLKVLSFKLANRNSMYILGEKGYIIKVDEFGYYAITDKGRRVLRNIHVALRQDYTYLLHNRVAKKNRRVAMEGHSKYTPEELAKRSEIYKKMMAPFWDLNIKMIPKSKKRRFEIVQNWVDSQKNVDPYYYQLLEKWSDQPALI